MNRFAILPIFVLALALGLGADSAPGLAKEKPLKAGSVHHLVSKKHDHKYSLYVPGNYSPRVTWPLVISSHGRGGHGKNEIGQWTGLAKEFGFIVACPDMCTATNNRPPNSKLEPAKEDEQVILSIYDEVGRHFRVNKMAVMITGFSGGGNPSYWTGLRHPDKITHICTRGGNFAIQQIPLAGKLVDTGKKTTRIYIYYGESDHPLILGKDGKKGQAQLAYDALLEAGYEHVAIEKIKGMKHQSRPRIAAEWFGKYLAANKKRFLAGAQADGIWVKVEKALAKKKYSTAVKELGKIQKLEEKHGLRSRAKPKLDDLNQIAIGKIGKAREAREGGDLKEALKLLGKISRDFKGLPAGDEAKQLIKEWKE